LNIGEIGVFKLASWNVNSLNVRLEQVVDWFHTSQTDVLALQETKVIDTLFPSKVFHDKGYHIAFSGQKTYNGVALISQHPLTDVITDIPGLVDPQRRILAATCNGIRIINLYVPNGESLLSDKYAYKLDWLDKVIAFIAETRKTYTKVAVVGDFNIAPEDKDVHAPASWEGCVLVSSKERQAFQNLLNTGLQDSFRTLNAEAQEFSWWDYRAAAFRRNLGLRIDHILLSDELMTVCQQSQIDKVPRKAQRPSDHTPVWVELNV
jgi:exodeoxyribonuclease III